MSDVRVYHCWTGSSDRDSIRATSARAAAEAYAATRRLMNGATIHVVAASEVAEFRIGLLA